MNINFSILWIDDSNDWVNSIKPDLEYILIEQQLILKMRYETGENDIGEMITSNEYDLILVDYQLANGKRGDRIIEQVRQNNVLTDIVFYSSDMSKMRTELNETRQLEGIYLSERDDYKFVNKIDNLVKKAVKRSNDVINLRGIVMDNTSEFDQSMKEILLVVFDKLESTDKEELINYVKKDVLQSSLKGLNKDFLKCIESENCLISSLNSKDYILSSDQKTRILSRVLEKLQADYKLKTNDKEFDEAFTDFYKKYQSDIIKYRNCLAHARKGEGIGKDILIGKIDGNDIRFNDELCTEMRAKLIKYSKLLDFIYSFVEDLN
jgi:hypothetical protein